MVTLAATEDSSRIRGEHRPHTIPHGTNDADFPVCSGCLVSMQRGHHRGLEHKPPTLILDLPISSPLYHADVTNTNEMPTESNAQLFNYRRARGNSVISTSGITRLSHTRTHMHTHRRAPLVTLVQTCAGRHFDMRLNVRWGSRIRKVVPS